MQSEGSCIDIAGGEFRFHKRIGWSGDVLGRVWNFIHYSQIKAYGYAITDAEYGVKARLNVSVVGDITPATWDGNGYVSVTASRTFFEGDLNEDWKVDRLDLLLLVEDWLKCNDPGDPECVDVP